MSEKIKHILDCDVKDVGTKMVCYACNTTFYSLGNADPICPTCNTPHSKSVKLQKNYTETQITDYEDEEIEELLSDDELDEEVSLSDLSLDKH